MEDKLTIKFELKNENGFTYTSSSEFQVYSELGDTTVDLIGQYLNTFLVQCGYPRRDNIFMESLIDDELETVAYFLKDYRLAKKNKEKNNEED
jgi:hypothetical protein